MTARRNVALRRVAPVLVALAVAAGPQAGHAGGLADEAELQFQIGADHYQKGEFRDALEHFFASNRLVGNRNVVFNIARSYEQLKRYADAHRYYTDALEDEDRPAQVQTIQAAIRRVAPFVAVLKVETSPPGATIYIDRKDLGSRGKAPRALALPEGRYRIIAELEGHEPAVSEPIEVKNGAEAVVPLKLARIVGTVDVTVEGAPGASVHLDDEHAPVSCAAPCKFEAPPGRHLLYFTREGFQSAPRQINVVARETVSAKAVLAPLTGSLVVSADERDAVVEIDGRPQGFTPAVIQNVAVGKRHVRVTLRGYAAVDRDIEVQTGQQTELVGLELQPLRQVSAVSRYAEAIEDAPSSVSIIDGQELRAFGYPTIAEALRGTRGIYLSNDRAYFSAGSRGLGEPNDYGNRLLVLTDGASLNDNILSSSYIGGDGRADLHDVDRIEIVRGPGSLLYGTGAFSGVVNLVPRGKDDPSSVHLGLGTYDNGVARGRVGFQYNFTPTTGIWASGSAARSDGVDVPVTFIDPKTTPATQLAHQTDFFRSGGTAGRFWSGPLTIQWFFHTREQHIPVGIFQTAFNDHRTAYTDSRYLAEIRFEPTLSDKFQLFTRVHADRYAFQGVYSYADSDPSLEHYYGTWLGGEARLVFTPVKEVRLTLGGEGQGHPQATMEGVGGDGKSYLDVNAPYGFGAGYLLGEANPFPWMHVSAGARVDVYSTFGAVLVPRAALIFKPTKGGALKIMGGRAFRAPSIYEQFYTDGQTQNPGNQPGRKLTLGPESIYSGELEYSQRFLESWVALVAGHAGYVQGIINTIPDPGGPGTGRIRYANSPDPALTVGGDVEVRREWRQGWMVSGMYGYQHAGYLDKASTRLINAPEHLASLKGVLPILPDLASLALRVTLEAPRRIDGTHTDTTPASAVADLTLSGNLKRFGVAYVLGLYNVMDTRYAYPVAETYLSRTIPQNGRTFLADVKVTYP